MLCLDEFIEHFRAGTIRKDIIYSKVIARIGTFGIGKFGEVELGIFIRKGPADITDLACR